MQTAKNCNLKPRLIALRTWFLILAVYTWGALQRCLEANTVSAVVIINNALALGMARFWGFIADTRLSPVSVVPRRSWEPLLRTLS